MKYKVLLIWKDGREVFAKWYFQNTQQDAIFDTFEEANEAAFNFRRFYPHLIMARPRPAWEKPVVTELRGWTAFHVQGRADYHDRNS